MTAADRGSTATVGPVGRGPIDGRRIVGGDGGDWRGIDKAPADVGGRLLADHVTAGR